ncbi:MAG TPA: c-type cytochrome [Vicinamibacterales bacterium]|nr:c-type cytochrome [Vicinamibacterales bacterium]
MRLIGFLVLVVVASAALAIAYTVSTGLDARAQPSALETRLARAVRHFAVPRTIRQRANPVPMSAEALADGMAHYADHCASCHGNNGSGDTEMGRGLFPKPPDMRQADTQDLTDGELFYIIEHGVRFTGMPGWSTGTESGEQASWRLVHFIRRLPQLTAKDVAQLETMNPRTPEEFRQQIEEEQFLRGGNPATAQPSRHEHTGAHR